MTTRQDLSQGVPAAMDVSLDLGQRHAKERGNLLVAFVLEMKEDERHPLVIWQPPQLAFEPFMLVGAFQIDSSGGRRSGHSLQPVRAVGALARQLAEQPP